MKETGHKLKDREGYDEMLSKLLQALPPEQRLAGLAPEERVAGLAPEERLALSDELLRGLPEEYIRSLPKSVQSVIRKRLGAPSRSRPRSRR